MRRTSTRQHIVQTQLQVEKIQEAVMYWFPVGFAFIGLILHIFPKMSFQF